MENTIREFYTAFANLDAGKMVTHYHKDIIFTDPAFGELKGEHAKNMWRMLCASQKGKNFVVKFSEVKSDQNIGSVNWEAFYNFSKTKRKIHNVIHAEITFKPEFDLS
jgi:ketosteroid isomerase-like protein